MSALPGVVSAGQMGRKDERRKRRRHVSTTVPETWKLTTEQQAFIELFTADDAKK